MKLYYLSLFSLIVVIALYFLSKSFFEKMFKIKKEGGFSLVPFGEKIGATGGLYLFLAPIIAMEWGWVPLVLYILIGMVLFGYPLSFMSTLLPKRFNIDALFKERKNFKNVLTIGLFVFSLLLVVSFIQYISDLLVKNPNLSTTFLLFVVLSFLFSFVIKGMKKDVIPMTVFFLVFVFYIIWIGKIFPLKLPFVVITEKFTWGIIITLMLILFAFLNEDTLSRPFSYLSSYLYYLLIIGGVFGPFIGVRIQRHAFSFSSQNGGILIPMIFGVLTFGIFSGFDSLFSILFTGKATVGEKDTSKASLLPISFLSLLALVSSFPAIIYARTDAFLKGKNALQIFQDGMARFIHFAGFSKEFGETIVLFTMIIAMFSFMVYAVKLSGRFYEEASGRKGKFIMLLIILIPFITFFLPKESFGGIENMWNKFFLLNTTSNLMLGAIMLSLISLLFKEDIFFVIGKVLNTISLAAFVYLLIRYLAINDILSLTISIVFIIINMFSLILIRKKTEKNAVS